MTSDWMSWAEAAEMVGCPVPTIDWYSREGRIEHRPFHGSRPTLRRSSVEAFAVWWAERQVERARRRAERLNRPDPEPAKRKAPPRPPAPAGWLSTTEAAAEIGMSDKHVRQLVKRGVLSGLLDGGRLWLEPLSVGRYKAELAEAITSEEAGKIAGCSPSTVVAAAQRGKVAQRQLGKQHVSLDRSSVIDWAEQRRAAKAAAQARHKERQRGLELAGRPDLEHEWLTQTGAAAVLGLSRNRVSQLARRGRLPFTAVGPRRWFRRDHMELVAAARRFHERFA